MNQTSHRSHVIVLFLIKSLILIHPVKALPQAETRSEAGRDSTGVSKRIEIFVRRTDKKITIDGVLDEDAWKDAEPYENYFFQLQPLDRAPSSEKTRVMVVQDRKTLYFGVQCFDSEPERIFASSMRRDMNYGSGDVLELLLDTFRDNRNCYAFDTNPLGGKGDAIISDQGNHINKQWDCVINMDGAKNDRGWAAEFAIPFKSLKYLRGDSVDWNINMTREIKHRREETYLVPIPRAWGHSAKFRGELFGLLRNVRPPKRGFDFDVTPYVLAGGTKVYGQAPQGKNELHGGADLRYDLTTQLALDLTVNTDFAQAESEEEIVNVTRFNVLRQEKREFFLQNAGLFQFGSGQRSQPNFLLFDSRTIGIQDNHRISLYGGGKLTGRAGPYSIAALSLQGESAARAGGETQSSTNYSAVRVKRDISKNSHIGMMALNRQSASDIYSRAFGLDGLWNVSQSVRLDASAARSFSPESSGGERAGDLGFILNRDWIDVALRYTSVDSSFNPRMGFVRRPGIRSSEGSVTFTKWINRGLFQNLALTSGLNHTADPNGIPQTRENSLTGSVTLRRGDEIRAGVTRSYEFVSRDTYIRDIRIGSGIYETWAQSVYFGTFRARPVNATLTCQWGGLFDGRQRSLSLTGTATASNHLLVDLAYAYNFLDLKNGRLVSHVLSTRWTYSFTPDLFVKTYLQWNTADEVFSANFLLDFAYRPKSHIYLVYNENQDTLLRLPKDRIVMLKMTYLWQV